MVRNALSVDLEEYYHGMEFEAALGPDRSRHLPSRVPRMRQQLAAHTGQSP